MRSTYVPTAPTPSHARYEAGLRRGTAGSTGVRTSETLDGATASAAMTAPLIPTPTLIVANIALRCPLRQSGAPAVATRQQEAEEDGFANRAAVRRPIGGSSEAKPC